MDRWESTAIQCTGGLVLNVDALTQGSSMPGSARILQNFEPSIDGGYRRISGYIKFDDDIVPGDSNVPVLGTKVALGGVFAARLDSTDNAINFSTGSGWALVSTAARGGSPSKVRFISYSITKPVVISTDGVNAAWKWDGSTETTINGAGAPSNPKYAALFRNRLVLSGYSANSSAISISAPNNDEDFTGGSGAIEINVGDTVTGLKTFREILYIFCKHTIKRLVGSSIADFAIESVTDKIGCVANDSIQEVGGDLIFMAPDGFRSLAATERIGDLELGLVSTQIQPLITPILGQGFTEAAFSSCTVSKKSQYRLFINNSSTTEASNLNFLGKFEGRARSATTTNETALTYAWATLVGFRPFCADSGIENNQEYVVFGHPTNGYVYRMESGSTFDGTNIQAIYRTPDITFLSDKSDATTRKVFQKLSIYSQVEGDVEFTVGLKLDREILNILQPNDIGISQSGAVPVYGTAIYGTDAYGQLTYPVFYTNLIGSGFTGAFIYASTDDSAPFRIDSFQVQLGLKGRR